VSAADSTSSCKVFITYQRIFDSSSSKKLGSIQAKEPGLGVNCQEDFVIKAFISDACSLEANLINIVKEKHPNMWSTCYRAKADIHFFKDTTNLKTDIKYHPHQILRRSKLGHKKTKAFVGAGVAGGIFGSIITN